MAKPKTPKDKNRKSLEEELGPKGMKRVEDFADQLGDLVDDALPSDAGFDEYERKILEIANEIVRRRLERKLQSIADSYPPALRIDHKAGDDWHGIGHSEMTEPEYARHLPGTVVYHSLVGPLSVRRFTYRQCMRNGVTYVPLELDVGLIERMTPGLAKCTAFAFSQMPIREAHAMLKAAGRLPPSRATLDRGAKDIGAYAVACNDEIEPTVREEESLPNGTVSIALGLDRTAVAMRCDDSLRFQHGRDLRRPRPKGVPRRQGVGVKWRMDYVGTVTFLDASGARLDSRHYRLPASSDPAAMADRMMADLRQALGQAPKLKIIVVQDGAPELWSVIRPKLKAVTACWEEVLDWYHVEERLTAVLDLSSSDPSTRINVRNEWHAILLDRGNPAAFITSLTKFGAKLPKRSREKFREHRSYFVKNLSLLGYRRIQRKHLPIGSGPTEGSCKALIGTRAKRSGQHWTQRGLSAALHLRSIEQSGRFDTFWFQLEQRYRATLVAIS